MRSFTHDDLNHMLASLGYKKFSSKATTVVLQHAVCCSRRGTRCWAVTRLEEASED